MKKYFVFFAAAAMMFAAAAIVSCKRDKDEPDAKSGVITTITAGVPDDEGVKLTLQGAGRNEALWTAGDKIYVAEVSGTTFDAAFGLSAFTCTSVAAGGKTGTFVMDAGQKPLTVGRTYVAAHVGNFNAANTSIASGAIAHAIPATVTQNDASGVANFANIDRELMFISLPVAATATGAAFAFQHLMSLLEFDIWTDDVAHFSSFAIDRVTVATGATNTFVTGLRFAAAGSGSPVNAATGTLTANLRSNATDGRYTLNATKRKLRIPLMWNPAVTAPTGDFTITLHPQTGTPVTFTRPARVLQAGMIYAMDLKAVAPVALPAITAHPANANVAAGGAATFSVAATGAGLSYQWENTLDGGGTWHPVANGAIGSASISGATTQTMTITNVFEGLSGRQYRCAVTNTAGTTNSNAATLTVTAAKSVSVGAQVGTMTAGVANSEVTYALTTANIPNGEYTAIVNNRPAGVVIYNPPLGTINITNNSGTLTLRGNGSQTAGTTNNLTLTIDGATSAAFSLVISAAATKTVSVGSQDNRADGFTWYVITTTNIAQGQAATVQWYSNSAGTTATSAPAGITGGAFSNVTAEGTASLRFNINAVASGTYYFRVTIDGVQSSNVGMLTKSNPDPTGISFGSTTTYYTWQGREFPVNYTLTPSGADPAKITWEQSSTLPGSISAVVTNTGSTSATVRTRSTGASPGNNSQNKETVTLTAKLPNGNQASVSINTRFVMWQSNVLTFNNVHDSFFNTGATYSFQRFGTNTRYVRAYYPANATQWSSSNIADPEMYLTKIANTEYTITSNDPDLTVARTTGDSNTWTLTRTSASVMKAVTLTITVGSQTYTQVVNLVD